jgi:hypothetical protein
MTEEAVAAGKAEEQEDKGFPGETPTAEEVQKQNDDGKWGVMLIESDQSGETVFKLINTGFRLQTESEAWIRENIVEGQRMAAVRIGKLMAVKISKKVYEVE